MHTQHTHTDTPAITEPLREQPEAPISLTDADPAEIAARRARRRAAEHQQHLAKVRAAIRQSAEAVVAHRLARWERLPLRIDASAAPSPLRPNFSLSANPDELARRRTQRVDVVRRVYTRLGCGETISPGALDVLIDELIDDATRAGASITALAFGPHTIADDLADHAFAVGTLCVSMAAALNWSRPDIRAAALAGLLADVGLTLNPHNIRAAERPLTEVELNALHRHPACSAALLELIRATNPADALPECVQIAVYQHHERMDGSGYPRRIRADRIHDLARLVAVADTFAGLRAPRAHRPALDHTQALTAVIRRADSGELDRACVRSLITALAAASPQPHILPRSTARAA